MKKGKFEKRTSSINTQEFIAEDKDRRRVFSRPAESAWIVRTDRMKEGFILNIPPIHVNEFLLFEM